jgi:hypothetical protein
MLNNWLKILPYFVVEYLAKKYCEQISNKEKTAIYTAFEDSYINLKIK